MEISVEGIRNLYVDGASNSEVLPSTFRNFAGHMRKSKDGTIVNNEGARNFNLAIPESLGQELANMGAKVKVRPSKDEGGDPLYYIKVNINIDSNNPPVLYFYNKKKNKPEREITLNEYGILDGAYFDSVALVINMYHKEYDQQGNPLKTTFYLQKGYFTLHEDPITAKYGNYIPEEDSVEEPMPWD